MIRILNTIIRDTQTASQEICEVVTAIHKANIEKCHLTSFLYSETLFPSKTIIFVFSIFIKISSYKMSDYGHHPAEPSTPWLPLPKLLRHTLGYHQLVSQTPAPPHWYLPIIYLGEKILQRRVKIKPVISLLASPLG